LSNVSGHEQLINNDFQLPEEKLTPRGARPEAYPYAVKRCNFRHGLALNGRFLFEGQWRD
jgi:hypothetical protein